MLAKYTPRFITILIAKLLIKLMMLKYEYDIILYNELRKFVEYNKNYGHKIKK